jgi:hypothetical protein
MNGSTIYSNMVYSKFSLLIQLQVPLVLSQLQPLVVHVLASPYPEQLMLLSMLPGFDVGGTSIAMHLWVISAKYVPGGQSLADAGVRESAG